MEGLSFVAIAVCRLRRAEVVVWYLPGLIRLRHESARCSTSFSSVGLAATVFSSLLYQAWIQRILSSHAWLSVRKQNSQVSVTGSPRLPHRLSGSDKRSNQGHESFG